MSVPIVPATWPTTVPADTKVVRGCGRIDFGVYTAPTGGVPNNAGGTTPGTDVGTFYYLGQIAVGGIHINASVDYGAIDGEEQPTPSDAFPIKEAFDVTATLNEVPIQTWNLIQGGSCTPGTIVSGNVAQGIGAPVTETTIGESHTSITDARPIFYQVVVSTSDEGSGIIGGGGAGALTGIWQFWKCLIIPAGAVVFSRDKHVTMGIKIVPLVDWAVTPGITATSSYSRIGRRIVTTA